MRGFGVGKMQIDGGTRTEKRKARAKYGKDEGITMPSDTGDSANTGREDNEERNDGGR